MTKGYVYHTAKIIDHIEEIKKLTLEDWQLRTVELCITKTLAELLNPHPRILNPDIKEFVEQTNRRLNNG